MCLPSVKDALVSEKESFLIISPVILRTCLDRMLRILSLSFKNENLKLYLLLIFYISDVLKKKKVSKQSGFITIILGSIAKI